jgi:hypothetical protein
LCKFNQSCIFPIEALFFEHSSYTSKKKNMKPSGTLARLQQLENQGSIEPPPEIRKKQIANSDDDDWSPSLMHRASLKVREIRKEIKPPQNAIHYGRSAPVAKAPTDENARIRKKKPTLQPQALHYPISSSLEKPPEHRHTPNLRRSEEHIRGSLTPSVLHSGTRTPRDSNRTPHGELRSSQVELRVFREDERKTPDMRTPRSTARTLRHSNIYDDEEDNNAEGEDDTTDDPILNPIQAGQGNSNQCHTLAQAKRRPVDDAIFLDLLNEHPITASFGIRRSDHKPQHLTHRPGQVPAHRRNLAQHPQPQQSQQSKQPQPSHHHRQHKNQHHDDGYHKHQPSRHNHNHQHLGYHVLQFLPQSQLPYHQTLHTARHYNHPHDPVSPSPQRRDNPEPEKKTLKSKLSSLIFTPQTEDVVPEHNRAVANAIKKDRLRNECDRIFLQPLFGNPHIVDESGQPLGGSYFSGFVEAGIKTVGVRNLQQT